MELLEAALQDERDGKTRAQHIIDKVISLAEKGRPWAVKMVLDRLLPAERFLNVGVTAIPENDPDEVRERILAKLRVVTEPGVPTIPAELTKSAT